MGWMSECQSVRMRAGGIQLAEAGLAVGRGVGGWD